MRAGLGAVCLLFACFGAAICLGAAACWAGGGTLAIWLADIPDRVRIAGVPPSHWPDAEVAC